MANAILNFHFDFPHTSLTKYHQLWPIFYPSNSYPVLDFVCDGKYVFLGRRIIFQLVARENVTPRAPGINQTGLHKFPNRGKTNTGNCKSLVEEISFGKRGNISYLVLEVWVCCGWGGGGPWKEIGYDLFLLFVSCALKVILTIIMILIHLEVRLMAPAASRSPSWSLSLFMSRSASVSAMLSVSSWEKKYYQIKKDISRRY